MGMWSVCCGSLVHLDSLPPPQDMAFSLCRANFPPESFVGRLNTPCDLAVCGLSEMVLNDQPSSDPRWSDSGGKSSPSLFALYTTSSSCSMCPLNCAYLCSFYSPPHPPHLHILPTSTSSLPPHPTSTSSLPPHPPYLRILPTSASSLPPHSPYLHILPTSTSSLPPHPPYLHTLPTSTPSLPPHSPYLHILPTSPEPSGGVSSMIILYQLEDKQKAHSRLVQFLTDVGLLDQVRDLM